MTLTMNKTLIVLIPKTKNAITFLPFSAKSYGSLKGFILHIPIHFMHEIFLKNDDEGGKHEHSFGDQIKKRYFSHNTFIICR